MVSSKQPGGLLSSFNRASFNTTGFAKSTRALFAAAAIGLLAGCAGPAIAQNTDYPTPITHSQQSDDYVYDDARTVRLSGNITPSVAEKVITKLLELSRQDPEADIELRINSGGGSVVAGMAIYDVMKSLPNDIRTVCEGEAQSMAAFLLSAGAQGKRYTYPNCEIMYHQPSWGVNGQITDMDVITAQGNASKDAMIRIIAEDSGWSEDFIRNLLERNFYPTAKEAKEMGFVDHIIRDQNPDPAAPPKFRLPDGFCDNPGRRYIDECRP